MENTQSILEERAAEEGLPPHSVEAEEAVLGSVLMDADILVMVADKLKKDDFFIIRHRWIWEAIMRLHERYEPTDYLTVVAELEQTEKQKETGGAAYLLGLINKTPTAMHIEGYAQIVSRASLRRKLIRAASKVARTAHNTQMSILELVGEAETILHDVTRNARLIGIKRVSNREVGVATSNLVDGIISQEQDPNYISVGLRELERGKMVMARGLSVGLLGGSGVGKSALVAQMTQHMAEAGLRVLTIPLEMPPERVMLRMAQASTMWTNDKGKTFHGMTEAQIEAAPDAYNAIQERIDALSNMDGLCWATQSQDSIAAIEGELVRLGEEGLPVDVVVVDSVQKLSDILYRERGETETSSHKNAWTKLARLAMRRKILVIGVSEFNKGGGLSRRPKLDDIPFGGQHELDIVLGLYREKSTTVTPLAPRHVTLQVEGLKVRYNQAGLIVELNYDLPTQRIW